MSREEALSARAAQRGLSAGLCPRVFIISGNYFAWTRSPLTIFRNTLFGPKSAPPRAPRSSVCGQAGGGGREEPDADRHWSLLLAWGCGLRGHAFTRPERVMEMRAGGVRPARVGPARPPRSLAPARLGYPGERSTEKTQKCAISGETLEGITVFPFRSPVWT